jgi:hypothetical protein
LISSSAAAATAAALVVPAPVAYTDNLILTVNMVALDIDGSHLAKCIHMEEMLTQLAIIRQALLLFLEPQEQETEGGAWQVVLLVTEDQVQLQLQYLADNIVFFYQEAVDPHPQT